MSQTPFSRVAVLNRGEAAVRFMRAARTWGRRNESRLHVIALYTTPDRDAAFVKMASEAIDLGDPFVNDDMGRRSVYVDLPTVMAAIKACGADAVWPGWGFLSENPALPDACRQAGITFIGPSGETMRALGDKVAAKRLAEANDVPVSPWSGDPVHDPASARAVAERIGYPVLLKAAAGGGGRGIRRVNEAAELTAAFDSARAEAASAFGDDSIFVESFVPVARHVEVQVLADRHGTVWALGTRDCSVQRRNQKVLEEAPAPGLSTDTRTRLEEAARAVALASDYEGAGTAEFLLLPDGETFYFLEMNTRLQVEHTVTEEVYGIDLVGAQIDIAHGRPLSGDPPAPRGVAIQARLNAEDPDDNFAPRAGLVTRFSAPQGPGIRVDSGYAAGHEVPAAFDSNIAKIIAWGSDRQDALARLHTALRDCIVAIRSGLTNRSLLLELVAESEFRDGPVTTRWLDTYIRERAPLLERPHFAGALLTAAIGDYCADREGALANFRLEARAGLPRQIPDALPRIYKYRVSGVPVEIRVAGLGPNTFRVCVEDWSSVVRMTQTGERTWILEHGRNRVTAIRVATPAQLYIDVEGVAHRLTRMSDGRIRAMLPAAVSQVHVKPGQKVSAGDKLVTLEVMKMEVPLESPMPGRVAAIEIHPSSQVAAGDLLLVLEDDKDADESGPHDAVQSIAARLPVPESTTSGPVDDLLAFVRGYDIDVLRAREAAKAVAQGDYSRSELLSIVRSYVVHDLLFQDGPYDDAVNAARESSAQQLTWYVQHHRLDEEVLSARIIRRLRRMLLQHGVRDEDNADEIHAALLRTFQSRRDLRAAQDVLLTVLGALATTAADDPDFDEARGRRTFETFALSAIAQKQHLLATAAWNLIYLWYDQPAQRKAAAMRFVSAEEKIRAVISADTHSEVRASEREALYAMSLRSVLGAVVACAARDRGEQLLALQIAGTRVYDLGAQDTRIQPLDDVSNAAGHTHTDGTTTVAMLATDADEVLEMARRFKSVERLDVLMSAEMPSEAIDRLASRIADADRRTGTRRERITFGWPDSRYTLGARTYRPNPDGDYVEDIMFRGMHPARPHARDIQRVRNLQLERAPAPGSVFLARSHAEEDQERFLAYAEVERFDPQLNGETIRVPAFEKTYLDALWALRDALGERRRRRVTAWNRVTIHIRPVVELTRAQIEELARRLGPPTLDLGLESVFLRGRFTFGECTAAEARPSTVVWQNPIGLGARVTYEADPPPTPTTLTTLERRIIDARRRGLFYPYELIDWLLTQPSGEASFEEWDIDATGNLAPVGTREPGNNEANLVVGLISNATPRFPEGMERVLLVGDPTRTMGSLAEPECVRVLAAFDLAEQRKIPVEWVSLSSGAKIAFDSGTENLDWTARVLRRIITFTQAGGIVNVVVDGPCVGAQSYWNAEATMLNHCRGTLVMTPRGYMILTGKRALEYSGSVSGESNEAIGGLEIMAKNGEAQYAAPDLHAAYELLFRHYDLTYPCPSSGRVRAHTSEDPLDRDAAESAYDGGEGFAKVGEIFSDETNAGRKRPFRIRQVMRAVLDTDVEPLERWEPMVGAETSVVWHAQLGGVPVCAVGIESQPIPRTGQAPVDGPDSWSSGTLFPRSSQKVARAINAASGLMPVVVIANLSGFDGSPESLRERQLEFGAEIGRAVVNFDGPIVFCVVGRYHGGAYVVFSQDLNDELEALALEGSYASVIGGAPAAAVVFPRQVRKRVDADERVVRAYAAMDEGSGTARAEAQSHYARVRREVEAEIQAAVAAEFDAVHSVERAKEVGSISDVIEVSALRRELAARVRQGLCRPGSGYPNPAH